MAGIKPELFQAFMNGKISRAEAEGQTASKPTTTVTKPSSSGGSSTPYSSGLYGAYSSNYSAPAASTAAVKPAPAATSYTGSSNVIGNVSGSNDLYKSYQEIYNSTRNDSNANSQLNTWGDSKGNIYDTTQMTPQQIHALSLFKDNNPKAAEILKGMGLDMNGNPTSPTPTYSSPSVATSPPAGGLTSSATYRQPGMQYNTLTPLASAAPRAGYVKNAEVDAKPLEEQLQYYASNPEEAKQEILRAKGIWEQNTSNPQAQAGASEWAKMMRQAAGIAEDDEAYGSVSPQQSSTGGGNNLPPDPLGDPVAQGPLGGVVDVVNNNQVLTDQLMGEWAKLMQGINGNNPQLQQTANQQGQAIFDQKKTQYQQLIDSLKSGQANDLKNIANDTTLATSELEDKTFQKWLETRQGVANRGLAGSGAASEADTRLLLARQKDLGGLFNTQSKALNNVNQSYSDKLAAAQATLAGNNLGQTQADIFSKLFKDSQGSMSDQLKSVTDLLEKQFGYSQINPADYLKNSANIYATDARTKVAYDKMDQQDRQFYDDLGLKNKELGLKAIQWQNDYGLKAAQIFGQDANGNPTLDARKLAAELALKQEQLDVQRSHNRVTESQGWARINQTDQQMTIKLQDMQNRADQFSAQMQNTAYKDQASALSQIMDTESKNMLNARSVLNNKNSSKEAIDSATAAYNKAATKIESTQTILRDISKLPKGTLGDTGGGSGNYDISELPDNLGDSYFMGG